jgi:hypothetical protein
MCDAATELTVVSRTNSDGSVFFLIAAGDRAKAQCEIDRIFRIAEDAGGTANAIGPRRAGGVYVATVHYWES